MRFFLTFQHLALAVNKTRAIVTGRVIAVELLPVVQNDLDTDTAAGIKTVREFVYAA